MSSSLSAQIFSLQTVCMGSGYHILTAIHFAYMSFVHCCTISLPSATQRVISASGHSKSSELLLWISSSDSLCFISLLAQNHLLPTFSIKGSLCVLIANYSISDYFLLLFSSLFLLATWILGSLHQYHKVKMQIPGPTADQLNQV